MRGARSFGYDGLFVRKIKLHWWILAGILAGAIVGTLFNNAYYPDIARDARALVFDGAAYDEAQEAAAMKRIQVEEKRLFR